VLALWRTAATEPSVTDDAASIATLLAVAPDALVVATDGGAIVGVVVAAFDGWRGAMYRLAVLPSYRRHGVASRLVREGERRLRARGARRLHMIVAADQEPAQAFWAQVGYTPSDQVRFVKNLG
jgi:ribosomal protein S18 acetylase RimI-like enzyme